MEKEKRVGLEESIEIPKGIDAAMEKGELKIKGPKGELTKKFLHPLIKIEVENNKVVIRAPKGTKREKKIIGTFKAHIKNMINGCDKLHVYILKICSGHFPMNVSLNNNELIIKNFFGEKVPRTVKVREGVRVKVEGDLIIVEGVDIELCGKAASDIEKVTKRASYDRRIFQDGIYIIKKDEKEIK